MITSLNYIYSKSALARILNISASKITRFEVWANVVFVIIKGQRPKFYSKSIFKQEFLNFRQRNSKFISIIPHAIDDKKFQAYNEKKDHHYFLEIYESFDGLVKSRCNCDDYLNQGENRFYLSKELGKNWIRKCKHQIALEQFLGGSLKNYVQQLKAIDREADYLQAKRDLFGDYAYSY